MNTKTIEDIQRELRSISERASGSIMWSENCVTTYPTIAGKQLWSYFAALADRIEAAVEYTLAVEKAKAAGEGYAAGKQSVTNCNQLETVDLEGRCVYGAVKDVKPVGDAAKMREALSDACYAMFNFLKTQNGGYEEMAKALDKAKATLAAPPRNCDLYSHEEALQIWSTKKEKDVAACFDVWLYEKGGAK